MERIMIKEKLKSKNARVTDPYLDRRSGDDRRQVYDSDYFINGGVDRRTGKDRRQKGERRDGYIRVSDWSSVRVDSDRPD
jgi:hypothetical protein